MFEVELDQMVLDADGLEARFVRTISMPVAPWPGMGIKGAWNVGPYPFEDPDDVELKVTDVHWDVSRSMFVADVHYVDIDQGSVGSAAWLAENTYKKWERK